MYRAVKAGRTVIYSSQKGRRAVFKGGKAYKLPPGIDLLDLDEMASPSALYLSDSLPPVAFRGAFQLLITSPKKATWSEFAKFLVVLLDHQETAQDLSSLQLLRPLLHAS
jgi:hypothetical protein